MADSSESGICEDPDCSRGMFQTAHKPHTSALERSPGSEYKSDSEPESGPPEIDFQPLALVPRPETQDPRPQSELKCEVMGCEYSTTAEANLNQKIRLMEIHTMQAHPMNKRAQSGPRLVLVLALLIALLAVGYSIKETISTEARMKAMEEKDTKERTDKEARNAKEREEKEAQEAKERAEKKIHDAKEKEAQEQKHNAIQEKHKVDFDYFINQDPGKHSSITVQDLQFLDLSEFHRCKYIKDVDAKQYDTTVENLATLMEFNDAQKQEIILAKYSEYIVNVVEDFKYTDTGL